MLKNTEAGRSIGSLSVPNPSVEALEVAVRLADLWEGFSRFVPVSLRVLGLRVRWAGVSGELRLYSFGFESWGLVSRVSVQRL